MPLPSVTFRSELDPIVRKELDQFDGELTGYLLREHDDDGRHTHITAQSLTITGGPVTIDGVPITGGDAVHAHAPTHEPGGADPISNVAWTNLTNTFTQSQVVTEDVKARSFYERGRTVPMGEWITVPFNASDFTSSGATWTVSAGNVSYFRYTLIGKTLMMTFILGGTGTSAANLIFYIKVPGGFTPDPGGVGGAIRFLLTDGSQAIATGFISGGNLGMHLLPVANVPTQSNFGIQGSATFEVL